MNDTVRINRNPSGARDFDEFNADQSKSVWSLQMTMGLVGRKCGMTRVFTEAGESIPVTVIEAQPNRITQVKTVDRDGYRALQVSAGSRKASRVSRPAAGHFAAAKVEAAVQNSRPGSR